jgi:S1-C subfamily serine protease
VFESACAKNRDSIYGVHCFSIDGIQSSHSLGSGFTIAPGILATAAHLVHIDGDPSKPYYQLFEVIRSPDIGQRMESARLIAQDQAHDIALLRIDTSRSDKFLDIEPNQVPTGTICGSLGFPLGLLVPTPQGPQINLMERFQGSYISSFHKHEYRRGAIVDFYEIDSLMYNGSSGCPGFLINSKVIGMQSQCLLSNSTANKSSNAGNNTQLSISMWVPSMDIIRCARKNGINI